MKSFINNDVLLSLYKKYINMLLVYFINNDVLLSLYKKYINMLLVYFTINDSLSHNSHDYINGLLWHVLVYLMLASLIYTCIVNICYFHNLQLYLYNILYW